MEKIKFKGYKYGLKTVLIDRYGGPLRTKDKKQI